MGRTTLRLIKLVQAEQKDMLDAPDVTPCHCISLHGPALSAASIGTDAKPHTYDNEVYLLK